MTSETLPPDVLYLESNISVPHDLRMFGDPTAHEIYRQEVGLDGFEVTPVRCSSYYHSLRAWAYFRPQVSVLGRGTFGDFMADQLMPSEEDRNLFEQQVQSFHSSFRQEWHDNGLAARFFPIWRKSLEELNLIQKVTGYRPAVLYPHYTFGENLRTTPLKDYTAPPDYDRYMKNFKERALQISMSDLQTMGLDEDSSPEEIAQALQDHEFNRLIIGTFHLQSPGKEGQTFRDPIGFVRKLASVAIDGQGIATEAHLEVNRTDMTGFNFFKFFNLKRIISTIKAKRAFIKSPEAAAKTVEGQMISVLAEEWAGPLYQNVQKSVVLEDGPFRLGRTRRNHRRIVQNTRKLVAAAMAGGATRPKTQ